VSASTALASPRIGRLVANIQKAARYYGVNLSETDWHQLGVRRQQNLRAAAATRRARGWRANTETDSR
jgi:hypothetical protein